jgi:hypothetical protein
MFSISRCKGKGAFSVKLSKPRKLDFKKLKSAFNPLVDTPHVMVVEKDGFEVVVHKHGELLFKNCEDEKKIGKIAGEIYKNA